MVEECEAGWRERVRLNDAAHARPAYRAPLWLPGGHLQTIYPALFAPRPRVVYRRERWVTPDEDFIELDWAEQTCAQPGTKSSAQAPLVVLFHGLEGGSRSHYAAALMAATLARGWRGLVVHFRGCGGNINKLRRAYHSGDSAEIDWILRRVHASATTAPLYAVGVSLGGNALLKWLGEHGKNVCRLLHGAAAVSAPVDLTAAGNALDRGFNLMYTRNFLATMKRKTLTKLAHYPDLCDRDQLVRSRTLREFDNLVTAPLHGYLNTDDYWSRASSKPWLRHIAIPTLMINARNDPFLPVSALPHAGDLATAVTMETPLEGGHVGFLESPFPGHLSWLPQRVLAYFESCAPSS